MQYAVLALIFSAVVFAVFGIWLLVGQQRSGRSQIELRLRGIKQVKRLELGDALAKTRERELKHKEHRREALKKKAYSDIPALDKALRTATWAEKLRGMLLQAQMPISVTNFVTVSGLTAAMGVAITVLWRHSLDPLLAGACALVLGGSPSLYVLMKVRRRVKRFNSQLPDALDLLSSSVKAGQSLNAAIQNVAQEMPDPVGDEFRIMSDELTFGVDLDQSLRHLMTRVNTPDVRFFASALMIQKETGGNLSEVLDGLQKTIRERFRILGQVKTLTAQGKLSGLIVGMLPMVLCALIYFANPDYMMDLFTTKTGRTLLAAAGGLQFLGVVLIYKIVNIKV
jgi:tight adherence protein B